MRTDLLDDPIYVLVPASHKAAKRRAISLGELAEESWISSTRRSSCHQFVTRACREAGFEPQIGFESDDHGVWQGLVAAGMGVALAPALALESVYAGVTARPVALRPLKRGVFAIHRAGRPLTGGRRDARRARRRRSTRAARSSSRRSPSSRGSS